VSKADRTEALDVRDSGTVTVLLRERLQLSDTQLIDLPTTTS